MKYGLTDFFSGVVYIFVIFLPGAILIIALLYGIPGLACKAETLVKNAEIRWLLMIAGSFVLGHFISHAGSAWEDWLFKNTGIKRAQNEVHKSLRYSAREIVQSILSSQLVNENNIRRWAHALLRQSESSAFRDIERKDADRRFFRNFLVVMPVPIITFWVHSIWHVKFLIPAIVSAIIMILAYQRYLHQDGKFTQLIFEALIAAYPEKIKLPHNDSTEREARFKVKKGLEFSLPKGDGVDIIQGYLSIEKEHVVRVRVEGTTGYMTIKGKSSGKEQPEYEYQIPVSDARAIINNLCEDRIIEKTRYRIKKKGTLWEVDEFKGKNRGLVIAEIEGKSKEEIEEAIKYKPIWIGDDITKDFKYRNSNLAVNPQTQ